MGSEILEANFRQAPVEPDYKERACHREGQVEVGIRPSQERPPRIIRVNIVPTQFPAHRAHPGDQPSPVREQDEDEGRADEPEGAPGETLSHDACEKTDQALNHPLDEILQPPRHQSHLPGGELDYQGDPDDQQPDHDHRVRDREWTNREDLFRIHRELLRGPQIP